jgi:putative ABC transport system permease protein
MSVVSELPLTPPAPRARTLVAEPIATKASALTRMATMAKVAVAMMFHDKLKMVGTMLGVVFAVVLSNQQAGTFLGLLYKNIMFVRNTSADLWIVPPGTENLQAGKTLSMGLLMEARATPEIAWGEPLIYAAGTVRLPKGGNEAVTVIGTKYPNYPGGPWNLVAGDAQVLARADTMLFEDSERETLGGLNVGSVRELNGRRVIVGGFVWGLVPFGPSFAFADYELARELIGMPSDQMSYALLGLRPGADAAEAKARLQKALPEALVLTRADFEHAIIDNLLFRSAIGVTFGTSTLFGLIVGFVIVSLSMFSAVVDNVREFGTLKAIGATNGDLALLLLVQSVLYAVIGSTVGLFIVTRMALGIRSAKLALSLPPELALGTAIAMVVMCIFASSLALLRLRKVEPAMVFR